MSGFSWHFLPVIWPLIGNRVMDNSGQGDDICGEGHEAGRKFHWRLADYCQSRCPKAITRPCYSVKSA
jgi:hypothetical protein